MQKDYKIEKPSSPTTIRNIMNKSPAPLLGLGALCGLIVFAYNGILQENFTARVDITAQIQYELTEQQMSTARRLNIEKKRLLKVTKDTWYECKDHNMDGVQCKEFIDHEILTLFEGQDRYIEAHIVSKRATADEWYNCIVIGMDDNDLTLGRDGDGLVWYDFEWDGSGVAATPYQQKEIPPITCEETPAGATEGNAVETIYATSTDPTASEPQPENPGTGATADPSTVTTTTTTTIITTTTTTIPVPFDFVETPLVVQDEPVLVEGATIDEVINGEADAPLNGGVVLDPNCQSTPDGVNKLDEALAETPVIVPAGPRVLEPFDCKGMNGFHCCVKIKHLVRDADANGKAIQCFLDYEESTCKKQWWREIVAKKRVMVYENHNKRVSKAPKIEGSWPSCNDKWGSTRDWGAKSAKR